MSRRPPVLSSLSFGAVTTGVTGAKSMQHDLHEAEILDPSDQSMDWNQNLGWQLVNENSKPFRGMEDGFLPTNQISTAAHHCSQGCPTRLWLQCSWFSDADAWIRACWGKKSCLGKPLDLCWVAELVRIEVLSRDSMSCLFILCLQLVSLCTGCAHGNYVDACAIESYQMKILENGTSHNLVWGKPVTLFHTATGFPQT